MIARSGLQEYFLDYVLTLPNDFPNMNYGYMWFQKLVKGGCSEDFQTHHPPLKF